MLSDEDWQLTSSPAIYTLSIPHLGTVQPAFGLMPTREKTDIQSLFTGNASRCGFTVGYWLSVTNTGNTVANGQMKLIPDPQTKFMSASLAPTTKTATELVWDYTDIYPGEKKQIYVYLQMPDFDSMGDTLKFYSQASITGTEVVAKDTLQQVVTCSWDPNDKQVAPVGLEEKHLTLKNSWLDYTIRFQNTGTDTAFTVVLRDTLDLNLDLKTLELLSSSHNMQLSRKDRALTFQFDNILLPDSIVDEPGSHGFVRYRIKANADVAENTVVENKAYIFFDFNPAIETNTTMNTLITTLPKREVTGLPKERHLLYLYPNPSSGLITLSSNQPFTALSIYNSLGKREVYRQYTTGTTQESLSLDYLPVGLYLITVKTGSQTIQQRFIKH